MHSSHSIEIDLHQNHGVCYESVKGVKILYKRVLRYYHWNSQFTIQQYSPLFSHLSVDATLLSSVNLLQAPMGMFHQYSNPPENRILIALRCHNKTPFLMKKLKKNPLE